MRETFKFTIIHRMINSVFGQKHYYNEFATNDQVAWSIFTRKNYIEMLVSQNKVFGGS